MVPRRGDASPLLYWAEERENIRLAKQAGEKSCEEWTTDPILKKYRFCNVRRVDDRASQWFLNNVFIPYNTKVDTWTFIQLVALCRWVNWPPTIKAILEDGNLIGPDYIDLDQIGDVIEERMITAKSNKDKVWTGAYMVRAPSKKKYPGLSKGKFVTGVVVEQGLAPLGQALLDLVAGGSAERVWEALCTADNWGSFMAGQVVADLTYTPLLSGAKDLYDWAPQGPGSRRGFNRLMSRDLYARIPDEEWRDRLKQWRMLLIGAMPWLETMTLHDVQNCLCEVDKYLRVKNGEGRPRSTYTPETAY